MRGTPTPCCALCSGPWLGWQRNVVVVELVGGCTDAAAWRRGDACMRSCGVRSSLGGTVPV